MADTIIDPNIQKLHAQMSLLQTQITSVKDDIETRTKLHDLDLLTERQVARMVGVKAITLELWRSRRKGPAYTKLGRNIFYKVGDLRSWIDAQRIDPSVEAPANAGDVLSRIGESL